MLSQSSVFNKSPDERSVQLYYVYDPMCSWCWGYRPTLTKLLPALSKIVPVQFVLGGLAPDTDQLMPASMQAQISSIWYKIEAMLGTEFNHSFWETNVPKRSTYPACRAVIAARHLGAELKMVEAIQHAYYLRAMNPSNDDVLLSLSAEIGLPIDEFQQDFLATTTQLDLVEEIAFARSIGGNSFPSWIIRKDHNFHHIPIDYQSADATLAAIEDLML